MTTPTPLQGAELIDCARVNGPSSIQIAAERCREWTCPEEFEQSLEQAYDSIGVKFRGFDDLAKPLQSEQDSGVVITPNALNQL